LPKLFPFSVSHIEISWFFLTSTLVVDIIHCLPFVVCHIFASANVIRINKMSLSYVAMVLRRELCPESLAYFSNHKDTHIGWTIVPLE
jgi:hypothetical protein